MGEIDTDPIKSVRASVFHFGEKCNQIKSRSSSDDESEKDFEAVLQDLANCKLQLEAMDAAHKQTLLKQDQHEETVARISTLLKSSEFEKDVFINECKEARIRVLELESKIQEMGDELTELNSTQAQLLGVEKQLVAATDAKFEAMKQAEMIETVLSMEKAKIEEMVHRENMLNETILNLRVSYTESEGLKEEAEKELKHAHEKLVSKAVSIDSLNFELHKANELHRLAEEAAADSISNLNRIKEDYEHRERMYSDQVKYIELLESELTQLKSELRDTNHELEKTKTEMEEMGERDNKTQVEIALLKAELHKGRSKTAAAEAAELRAKGEKSAAYFALQQMAIETQELKKENQRLQSEHEEIEFQDSKSDHVITISLEEYEILVKKTEEGKNGRNLESEIESLKKDLESAMARVGEFRTRAEQAATRAEVAEQGKAALEEQIKRWKEQKKRQRVALAALRAESMSKSSRSFEYDDDDSKTYMPLGKFLKMNF